MNDMIYIYIYIFKRNWVETQWQHCITHLHTNNNITEKEKLGSAGRACLCELYPGICLTTEDKAVRVAQYLDDTYEDTRHEQT
jgi:hypothetical protein